MPEQASEPEPDMLKPAPKIAPRPVPFSPASVAARLSIALLLSIASSASRAEVRIEGGVDGVQVVASDSTVAEVLEAIGATFGLSYPQSGDLDRPVTRTFRGPLRKVLARLLEDYDYVATSFASGEIELIYLKLRAGRGGKPVVTTPVSKAEPQAPTFLASIANRPPPRWRRLLEKRAAKHMPDRSAEAYGIRTKEFCRRNRSACPATVR